MTHDHRHRRPAQRHDVMNAVAVSVGLTFAAIVGAILFVLWYRSATVIDDHEDRITGMEKRWAETYGGPALDDSPAAMAGERGEVAASVEESVSAGQDGEQDRPTDEFPAIPPTQPDGIAIQVQAALIAPRPSPVPRKSAEWVEAEIAAMRARNAERMARTVKEAS